MTLWVVSLDHPNENPKVAFTLRYLLSNLVEVTAAQGGKENFKVTVITS